ncbi:unnamed protein product, partial [Pylaiella littoralis]
VDGSHAGGHAGGEALPELGAWVNNSNVPDLPFILAEAHRNSSREDSSREDWFKLLGAGLLEVASDGNLEAVKQLLVGGAPLHSRDRDRLTPLHRASAAGHGGVVEFLLLSGDDTAPPPGMTSPGGGQQHRPRLVWQASTEGPLLVPSLSLRKKATVDARDSSGSCPVHLAAERGYAHVVQILLQHGTDVSCLNGLKQTPLHTAAAGGSSDCMRLLLGAGGEVMARDNAGRTPLHIAAFTGSPTVISTLVEGGADLEARGSISNRTALHEASASLRIDAVKRLLDLGADEREVDSDDLTASTMVGDWIPQEERTTNPRIPEMQDTIRRMLDDAPKQRLWRRRRLLPLLRWRQALPSYHTEPGGAIVDSNSRPSLAEFLAGLEEGVVRNIVSYL